MRKVHLMPKTTDANHRKNERGRVRAGVRASNTKSAVRNLLRIASR